MNKNEKQRDRLSRRNPKTDMKVLPLLLIGILTACWYLSSSRNAVGTQRLVEEMGLTSSFSAMLVLTALQLLTGLCISWPLHHYLLVGGERSPAPMKTRNKMIVGLLHFLGCFCTNMGFALGSASVVQVIKLLEPIETFILTALANVLILRAPHGLTFNKTISVLTIVIGTSMLLSQKRESELGRQVNFGSITFALCSGFAMASRNVYMKTSSKVVEPSTIGTNTPPSDGWKQIAIQGLYHYISMTSAAAVPGTLFFIAAETHGISRINNDGAIATFMFNSVFGREAIVFHGLYNLASISVLCLISTQSHSLLNVGKRIINVLYAGIVFRESIGFNGILGLSTAAIGGIQYATEKNATQRSTMQPFFYFMILAMMVSNTFMTDIEGYGIGSYNDFSFAQPSSFNRNPGDGPVSKFAVWMFPHPPPAKSTNTALSFGETLICAYSNACEAFENPTSINLRDLTHGTYYHNYVRDHSYHKVRHLNDFPYHIQAITLLSLLKSNGGKCFEYRFA